jgi:putative PIN family toxin of toxin-antitoxin system
VRVTFDSNVFVSALNYHGPPARLLELAAIDVFRLQLSNEILDETIRILTQKFHWSARDIAKAQDVLSSVSQRVMPHVELGVVKRDADDNRVLECAQSSGSDYIVTGDKDLLDIRHYAGARILNPLAVAGYSAAVRELHRSRHALIREMTGRNAMPAVSGVDPPADIRLSSNFFRCAGREWLPQSVDDPLFPSAVYAAGREYGWALREFCIVHTLFESGARISEVIGLTAADWAVS